MNPAHVRAIVFALAALTAGPSLQAAELPAPSTIPLADFFRTPKISAASMAPDGQHIALLVADKEDKTVLVVMPAAGGRPRVLASVAGRDIVDVRWVNSHRLLYSYVVSQNGDVTGFAAPGLYAVNVDGSQHVQLVSHGPSRSQQFSKVPLLPYHTRFVGLTADAGSNDIFVTVNDEAVELLRLNTVDGNFSRIPGPADTVHWVLDQAGAPRAVLTVKDGLSTVVYKDPATGWRKLMDYRLDSAVKFMPVAFTPDGQLLGASANGGNTVGVYAFDLAANRIAQEPVISLPHYDFNGALMMSDDRSSVLGVRYETSERVTTWFEPGLLATQRAVDKLLPATINELHPAHRNLRGPLLVHSYSDVDPGYWQIYDPASGKLRPLGTAQPQINPLQMSPRSFVRYKARDGLEIPAYVTVPKASSGKHLPMVVLVHGGPWSRGGHYGWSAVPQWLASRGYVVLEPEFRGSTGFGSRHFQAGWKQWGRAMQDDLADGAQWAIQQGYADPKRICIAGASYGGYATLMGLVRNPELFRCGVEWIGVTDIEMLFTLRNTDVTQETKEYSLPVLIGDPKADAPMLQAASPLVNASRITQPLLMAYGEGDVRVPIEHGKRFYEAVRRTNPKVQFVTYSGEHHGGWLEKNQLDFYGRMEKFLAEQLGQN